ncbi:MAG: hypothetical protein KF781_01700 [Chitinophagaceae bacterium]|nr:hypothetical protein [Chitinophagaceae bacterium]MCW5905450.1 hypothetical protein [Chitinophagaceae bacterium]
MKVKALTLLIIFSSFIVLPAVVSNIYSDVDVSVAFTLTEEENHTKSISEIIKEFNTNHVITFDCISQIINPENISIEFLLKHDDAIAEIFSPPPNIC